MPRLCGVAINAYLTMLLDTGVLHCDPHPGNLLRSKEGKLVILDWGMTQAVPEDLQCAAAARMSREGAQYPAAHPLHLPPSAQVLADRVHRPRQLRGLRRDAARLRQPRLHARVAA